MNPLWLLVGGGVLLALSQKKAAPPPPPPYIPPQLPPALPANATNAAVPVKIQPTMPVVTSNAITPGGLVGTGLKILGSGRSLLAIGATAAALGSKVAPQLVSTVTSTLTHTISDVWSTIGPFVGLIIFAAFAVAAILPLVFALVAIIARELRRPGAEFQETYHLAMQMKVSITQDMMQKALAGAGRALTAQEEALVYHLRNIWLTEYITQWNECRKKAAKFKDWQGNQTSNEIDPDPNHMVWMRDRGFFLTDDDVDTLESIVLYNDNPLTEDQLAWANWPYKQFVQHPSAPWVRVYEDARASGVQESDWKYVQASGRIFANAQYYLMASQMAKDSLGWIAWGPLNYPMDSGHKESEYWDWTNFMTGARWVGNITLPAGVSGVFYDSIDANGDVHFLESVLRVKESIQNEGKGFMRPVVSFNYIPDKYRTPKAAA